MLECPGENDQHSAKKKEEYGKSGLQMLNTESLQIMEDLELVMDLGMSLMWTAELWGVEEGLGARNGQSLERLANIGQYRERIVTIRSKGLIKM